MKNGLDKGRKIKFLGTSEIILNFLFLSNDTNMQICSLLDSLLRPMFLHFRISFWVGISSSSGEELFYH